MTTDLTLDAGQLTAAYAEPHGSRAFLVIHVEESGRPSTVIELADGTEVSFGRSRGATVIVDHEKVSRLHARVWRNGERIHLEDLESKNGTRVNGERVVGTIALAPGDEIAIGNATIVLGAASQIARRSRVADADHFDARLEAELDHANRYRHRVALVALRIAGDL
ncbi:MAG TPA: FHA domain-containing protein, partial [Kofleriaceae bacterium]|nr:FHA domain-containing protein [Kofleriaceae bacterium]